MTRWFIAIAILAVALATAVAATVFAGIGGTRPSDRPGGTLLPPSSDQQAGHGLSPAVPVGPSGEQSNMVKRPAPIEDIAVLVQESFPPQYSLTVRYGLPNGCAKPGGYDVERQGETIAVTVSMLVPSDPIVMCTQIYRIAAYNISLGNDFTSGQSYTVVVNGKTKTLTAQ